MIFYIFTIFSLCLLVFMTILLVSNVLNLCRHLHCEDELQETRIAISMVALVGWLNSLVSLLLDVSHALYKHGDFFILVILTKVVSLYVVYRLYKLYKSKNKSK